jgi:hypothetical protein
MTFNFPYLLFGLALLWFPRTWMRLGAAFLKRRRRRADPSTIEPWKARSSGDPRISFVGEFGKIRNYVDLARGVAGGFTVMGGMGISTGLGLAPDATHAAVMELQVLRVAILLIGVVIQTLRFEHSRVTFYPPIFYVAGVSVALCSIQGAAFAFVLIWTLNAAFGSAQAFLSVYALLLVAFGYFFGPGGLFASLCAGCLSLAPVLLSLLANRPLVIFSRKGTHSAP